MVEFGLSLSKSKNIVELGWWKAGCFWTSSVAERCTILSKTEWGVSDLLCGATWIKIGVMMNSKMVLFVSEDGR